MAEFQRTKESSHVITSIETVENFSRMALYHLCGKWFNNFLACVV